MSKGSDHHDRLWNATFKEVFNESHQVLDEKLTQVQEQLMDHPLLHGDYGAIINALEMVFVMDNPNIQILPGSLHARDMKSAAALGKFHEVLKRFEPITSSIEPISLDKVKAVTVTFEKVLEYKWKDRKTLKAINSVFFSFPHKRSITSDRDNNEAEVEGAFSDLLRMLFVVISGVAGVEFSINVHRSLRVGPMDYQILRKFHPPEMLKKIKMTDSALGAYSKRSSLFCDIWVYHQLKNEESGRLSKKAGVGVIEMKKFSMLSQVLGLGGNSKDYNSLRVEGNNMVQQLTGYMFEMQITKCILTDSVHHLVIEIDLERASASTETFTMPIRSYVYKTRSSLMERDQKTLMQYKFPCVDDNVSLFKLLLYHFLEGTGFVEHYNDLNVANVDQKLASFPNVLKTHLLKRTQLDQANWVDKFPMLIKDWNDDMGLFQLLWAKRLDEETFIMTKNYLVDSLSLVRSATDGCTSISIRSSLVENRLFNTFKNSDSYSTECLQIPNVNALDASPLTLKLEICESCFNSLDDSYDIEDFPFDKCECDGGIAEQSCVLQYGHDMNSQVIRVSAKKLRASLNTTRNELRRISSILHATKNSQSMNIKSEELESGVFMIDQTLKKLEGLVETEQVIIKVYDPVLTSNEGEAEYYPDDDTLTDAFLSVKSHTESFMKEKVIYNKIKNHPNNVSSPAIFLDSMFIRLILTTKRRISTSEGNPNDAEYVESWCFISGLSMLMEYIPFKLRDIQDLNTLNALQNDAEKQLKFMYDLDIAHGDVRSNNILVKQLNDGSHRVVMIDYGMSLLKSGRHGINRAIKEDMRNLESVFHRARDTLKAELEC